MSLRPYVRELVNWFHGDRVIHRTRSQFGPVRIVEREWDDGRIRVLEVAGTYQSATYLDERWCEPPFAYLKACSCVFEGPRPARDILMLGGGGFAFPKAVIAEHPEATIEVAELDPTIIELAHTYFFLDRLEETFQAKASGRLTIHCTDALVCLTRAAQDGRTFDAIINDVYQAASTPQGLMGTQAARLVASLMRPGGLYVVNLVATLSDDDSNKVAGLVETLSHAFAHIAALALSHDQDKEGNLLVVASDAPITLADAVPLFG